MKRKLLCLLLSMLLVTTTAQAAEKPNAAVDTSRSCTLTLQYAASGQTVRLYRAADISSNGRYTLCGAFAGYGIFMPAGNGQAEWDALRDTLLAYIAADALAPDGTAVTGADGSLQYVFTKSILLSLSSSYSFLGSDESSSLVIIVLVLLQAQKPHLLHWSS